MPHKAFAFKVKASDIGDDGTFEGYASTFGNKDQGGDIVMAGAFDRWLDEWKNSDDVIPILFNHQSGLLLGKYLDFKPDSKGLWAKGQLNLDTNDGREKRSLMKQGALSGLSIGYDFYPGGIRFSPEEDAYLLTSLKLWEVSLCTFPMNLSARVSDVKSAMLCGKEVTIREIEKALKELGFSQKNAKIIAKNASEKLAETQNDEGSTRRDGGIDETELKKLAAASKRMAATVKRML